MARKQSAKLERKRFFSDPVLVSMVVILLVSLALFVLYPLLMPLADSFYPRGKVTLEVLGRALNLERFQKASKNIPMLGMVTGITSTVIDLLFAYVEMYVKLKTEVSKELFAMVPVLPIASPPFALSLPIVILFGQSGIITRSLLGICDSNVYGLKGIAIAQIPTSFPVHHLTLKRLLKSIDPSLEKTTRDIEASRWKVFTSVTFSFLLPGLSNVFLVTFIESAAGFADPILIGDSYDTLATTIYLQVTGAYDPIGIATMSVVLLSLTVVLLPIQKYCLKKKTTATLTGKAFRMGMLVEGESATVPPTFFCGAVSAFVILIHIMVPFGVLFTLWGRDYNLSPRWSQYVFKTNGLKAFKGSFVLSLVTVSLTALLSMVASYLVVKKRLRAKGFIEFVSMLAVAIPGTVLGIGCIRGCVNGLFRTGIMNGLYGTSLVLTITFIVRSLPTSAGSGISALRQINKSIEESAYDTDANSVKAFMTIIFPLIKDSFLSKLTTVSVWSVTAISAIILLVAPGFLLITCQINEQAEEGNYGVAYAYATVLIITAYDAVLIMDTLMKFLGVSRRIKREN